MDDIFVLNHDQIKATPKYKTITYARLVMDFCPQQEDPNRIRMTARGNLIQYSGELTTHTLNLSTTKILWNSVVSTAGAKFAVLDISSMYLHIPLASEDYEYMQIPLNIFPEHTIEQYNLRDHEKGGLYTLKYNKQYTACRRWGPLQINC